MSFPMIPTKAMADVASERERNAAHWGEQNHTVAMWLLILGEEVGEVARGVLEFSGKVTSSAELLHIAASDAVDDVRRELVQVAAVALAAIECIDRNGAACFELPPSVTP